MLKCCDIKVVSVVKNVVPTLEAVPFSSLQVTTSINAGMDNNSQLSVSHTTKQLDWTKLENKKVDSDIIYVDHIRSSIYLRFQLKLRRLMKSTFCHVKCFIFHEKKSQLQLLCSAES